MLHCISQIWSDEVRLGCIAFLNRVRLGCVILQIRLD